jgi:hypothetical protein
VLCSLQINMNALNVCFWYLFGITEMVKDSKPLNPSPSESVRYVFFLVCYLPPLMVERSFLLFEFSLQAPTEVDVRRTL